MCSPGKSMYVTRSVAEELSAEHQFFIVKYLYENHKQLTDYLQVFEFYVKNGQQWLIQRQEVPERETTFFVGLDESKPINQTLWVMDQGEDGTIILFPADY